jgi:thioredoxin 1
MLDIQNGFSLVKFGATWCGPCKAMDPVLAKLEQEYDNVKIIKIDVDDNPELAKNYKIKAVPTVILFDNGKEIARIASAMKIDVLRNLIKETFNLAA